MGADIFNFLAHKSGAGERNQTLVAGFASGGNKVTKTTRERILDKS